jgi:hypothetical protein
VAQGDNPLPIGRRVSETYARFRFDLGNREVRMIQDFRRHLLLHSNPVSLPIPSHQLEFRLAGEITLCGLLEALPERNCTYAWNDLV